jgi:redox-sensitive bicupin YhaK (pirin superfamily)
VSVRVIAGEINSKDATTRLVVPTTSLPIWGPFQRVAETIATPRRRYPPHGHEKVEVLTYLIEGSGMYEYGPSPAAPILPGAVNLLTAPSNVTHAINPGPGQTLRYFAVVATLPGGEAHAAPRLQSSRPEPAPPQPDGTVTCHLVGAGKGLVSAVGLESDVIEFRSAGAAFRKVGHDRIAVGYVLSGRGRIDNQDVEAGEAVLVEDAAGIALDGRAGLRMVLTSAPRPA